MIYNFEEIDKEHDEIREWNTKIHLRNIDEMMEKLEHIPKPCEMFECSSTFISGTRCKCMRSVFDNEQHLIDYQNFLHLLLRLLITDSILGGYLHYEDHEEKE